MAVASCGDDGGGSLADAPGNDTPPAAAMLVIDRSTASFGSITLGTLSPITTFTVTNAGASASGALATALSGTDASGFAVGANTCTGTLAAGANCTVAVTFAPTTVGTKTASLMVVGMPGGTVTATLDGTGIGLGALAISSTQSSLGSIVVGQTSTQLSTFTVTNTGTAASGPLVVIPAGSDPSHFVKSNDLCSTMTLAPAATCTFDVRFAPLSAGVKSSLVQVNATPGGSVSGAISGTGLAVASLRGIPLQLEFGSVVVTQTSPNLTVTVANLGGVATGALGQTVSGSTEFSVASSTCSGTMLAGGTSCTITLSFTPTGTGSRAGLLTITGAPGGSITTSLVGEGIAGNQLSITPSARAFANTNVGQVASAQAFVVTNNTGAAAGPLAVGLGGDAAQFRAIAGSDSCTGNSLAAGATCTISVTFAPTTGGIARGTLTVAGSPGGSVAASLSGAGVSTSSLAITPPSQGFGSVVIGSMSPPLTFTVSNLGGQPSGIPAASLTGASAAQFAIAGSTCTATLGPGASCTVQVRFAPSAAGAATAALSVSATPGGTVMGALTGDGVAPGGILILPSSTTFPVTSVGDSASTQTLTVLNTGAAVTGAISIATTGDFASTNTCATLPAGGACAITVTFTPTALGARNGTVTATASPGGSASAALAGSGRPRLEILSLSSGPVVDPANLGTAIINNSTPHDVLILVRNNTSTSKTLGTTPSFGSPAQYRVVLDTCSGTIGAAGGLCTIGVRFAPTTTGTKNGSVTFDIGAGAQNQATQNLTGIGTESLRITALAGSDFGAVPVNITPGALTFRITNPAGSQTSGTITAMLAGGSAFAISADGCTGQTLVAGASCLVDVTFSPTTVAAAMTTLNASASPGGMPFININGNGVMPTGSAPTDLSLSPSSIAEGTPAGSTVGSLTTTDADAGNTFTYAFVGGAGSTDNAAFTITGAMVQTAGVLDFETKSSYAVRIRVTDSGGNIFEKALTISVTNVDEAPTAVDDAATVAEDDPATAIDVLANDIDIDAGPKMILSVTQGTTGTVAVTGAGTGLTYTPAANFSGGDTFTYTLNGGSLATVTVNVAAVDDAPVAVADSFTVAEDSTAGALNVLANDTDIDVGPISVASVVQPANGTVAITTGGAGLTYTPAANFSGTDTFTYTLSPGNSTATVTLTVTPIDDAPTAVDEPLTTILEDTPSVVLTVLANDTDPDGGPIMITSTTTAANGMVFIAGPEIVYQPDANFFGTDEFTYTLNGGSTATVTIDVTSVNDVPFFTKGANQNALEDASAVTVTGWASPIGKGPANESAQVVDFIVTATNGTLFSVAPAVSADGTLTFTPAADAVGTSTVTVAIHDDGGTANGGVDTSATQMFTITIAGINDAPSFTKGADQTVNEDAGLQTELAWATGLSKGPSDEASQALDFIVSNDNNSLFLNQPAITAGGTLTFRPAANASGSATVTVQIHDNGGTANGGVDTSASQTFTITVNAINDAPTFANGGNVSVAEDSGAASISWASAVSAGPADESGQSLSFSVSNTNNTLFNVQPAIASDGTLTFTPAANQNGTAIVSVTLQDNGGTANGGVDTSISQMFMITVAAVDDPPVAIDDSATIAPNSLATAIDVLANDTDIDMGSKAVGSVTQPANGTAVAATTNVTYKPNTGYCNTQAGGTPDTFTYTLTPGASTATVSVTVPCSADLSIALVDSPDPVTASTALSYAVSVANLGPTTAETPSVVFTVPVGASYTSFVGAGWSCSNSSGTVSCTAAGALVVGAAPALAINVTAPAAGGDITAMGTVSSATTDPVPGNNVASATTHVKLDQTITFTSTAPNPGVFNTTYTVTATASSNLTVAFSTASTGCTVVGSTVSFTSGSGTCVVDANQFGDADYNMAPTASQTITLGKADQTITFTSTAPASGVYNTTYTVSASGGGSGNMVTFTSADDATCTVAGSTVTFTSGTGTCTVRANQPGNTNYNAATQATQAITLGKASQSITFTSTAPNPGVYNTTYVVAATGGASNNTVTFTSTDDAQCSVSGTTVTFNSGTGTCTLQADQAGDTNYNAAPQQTQDITLGKASQSITFTSTAPSPGVYNTTYNVTADGGGSSNAVTFTSADTTKCTISGSTVTFASGTGTCTVRANQLGDTNYNAALQQTQDIALGKASQSISFTSTAPNPGVFNATYTVSADGGGSGNAVTFTSADNAKCTVSGSTVTFASGTGTCTVRANQTGDANYNAATQATQDITLGTAGQTISFTSTAPSNATVGGATYTVTATASSGLTVTFGSATMSTCTVSGSIVSFVGGGTCTVTADQSGNGNYSAAPQVTQSFSVNTRPTASPLTFTFAEDNTYIASLGGFDADDNDLTFAVVTAPQHGTMGAFTVDCSSYGPGNCVGAFLWTPEGNYVGSDSFTYKVNDGKLDSTTVTVMITITEVNDSPTATADTLTAVLEDSGTRTIAFTALTGNDSSGPANESTQTLTISAVGTAVGGTVSISGSNVLFTPTANFNGTASFQYTLTDNGTTAGSPDPKSATGSVSFTVTSVNDAPVVANQGNLTYTLNSGAKVVSGAITVTDDGNVITGATVTGTGVTGNDVLAGPPTASLPPGVTVSYSSGTKVLTVAGSATPAQYQAILQAVTFTATSGNGTRTLQWVVTDGSLSSSGVTSTITIN